MKKKNFYFASANTGEGFVNHLGQVAFDGFMYIIKGGSGTGKSTMMKKIAQHFFEQGCSVEYYHCSTAPESLDGIYIPEKKVAVVDGTAPHIINPQFVGATHKVLDVGRFVGDMQKQKFALVDLGNQKYFHYQNMYTYLSSARLLDDINFAFAKEEFNQNLTIKKTKDLFSKIKNFNAQPQNKTLFLQSINAGIVDLEKQNKFQNVVFSAGRYEAFCVLESLSKLLDKNHISHTKILDSLNPKHISAVVLNNQIIVKNINNNLKTNKKIEKNNILIKKIIKNAQTEIMIAKNLHTQIEKIYLPNVDFSGVETLTQKTIEEIEG